MAKSVTLSALGGLLGASYLSGAFVTPTVSPAQPAPALRGAASIASGNGVSPVTGAAATAVATAVATAAVALVASRKSKKTSSAWLGGNSWRGLDGRSNATQISGNCGYNLCILSCIHLHMSMNEL